LGGKAEPTLPTRGGWQAEKKEFSGINEKAAGWLAKKRGKTKKKDKKFKAKSRRRVHGWGPSKEIRQAGMWTLRAGGRRKGVVSGTKKKRREETITIRDKSKRGTGDLYGHREKGEGVLKGGQEFHKFGSEGVESLGGEKKGKSSIRNLKRGRRNRPAEERKKERLKLKNSKFCTRLGGKGTIKEERGLTRD